LGNKKKTLLSAWFEPPSQQLAGTHTPFVLHYEPDELQELYRAVAQFYKDAVKTVGMQIVTRPLAVLLAPLQLPLLASTALDNPFAMALKKADKAAVLLAESLATGAVAGARPTTLVAAGVGGHMTMTALESLARGTALDALAREGSQQTGSASSSASPSASSSQPSKSPPTLPPALALRDAVETVVFLGAPIATNARTWNLIRALVPGRIVNVYSRHDWVSRYVFRTLVSTSSQLAACAPVLVDGVENIDASAIVDTHVAWQSRDIVDKILKIIDIERPNRGPGLIILNAEGVEVH
jgi:hypothetical protein